MDEAPRGDLCAGLALGAATAIKFTGFFLLALSAATVLGLASTPFALIHFESFFAGVSVQWRYHYHGHAVAPRLEELSFYYLTTFGWGLGPVAVALVFVGVWGARRSWRSWAPVVAVPVVTLIVLSTAEARWVRLTIPALGALSVVAALGFETVAARVPRAAWATAAAAAVFPLAMSMAYVRETLRPGTRDVVVDWVTARLPPASRILSGIPGIGIDRRRFEIVTPRGILGRDQLLAGCVDAILWPADAGPPPLEGRQADFVARSGLKVAGPSLFVFLTPPERRESLKPVDLRRAVLKASANSADLGRAVDGDLDTFWVASARWGRRLGLPVSDDGLRWQPALAMSCRPPVAEQVGVAAGQASQILAVEPVRTRWLRIAAMPAIHSRWGFAELRIDALDDAPPGAR